jgi:hypothetical protein
MLLEHYLPGPGILHGSPAAGVHVPSLSRQTPGPDERRPASLTKISHFLTTTVSLNRIGMANLRLEPKVDHRLLPSRAMPTALPSMSLVGQQVRIFMLKSVVQFLGIVDYGLA